MAQTTDSSKHHLQITRIACFIIFNRHFAEKHHVRNELLVCIVKEIIKGAVSFVLRVRAQSKVDRPIAYPIDLPLAIRKLLQLGYFIRIFFHDEIILVWFIFASKMESPSFVNYQCSLKRNGERSLQTVT